MIKNIEQKSKTMYPTFADYLHVIPTNGVYKKSTGILQK